MKRIFLPLAVAAVATVTVLAGCTVNMPGAQSTPTASHAPGTSEHSQDLLREDTDTREGRLLKLVHDEYPDTKGLPDSTITDVPPAVCDALDSGATVGDILGVITKSADGDAETARMLGYVVGAGVEIYCPQYSGEIRDYADQYGGA